MFTYYENTLCVQGGWLYGAGGILTDSNYKYHKRKGNLRVLNRACKGTPVLVEYGSLPERYRLAIEAKVGGHPRKLATSGEQLERQIVYDKEAEAYYAAYLTDGDNAESVLPKKTQREYTSMASILNMVGKKAIALMMQQPTRKKSAVWESLAAQVAKLDTDAWPHQLPENGRRFRERYKRYKKEGYASLVHKNFSNKNSEKIHKDAGVWLLARWADKVRVVPNLAHLLIAYNAAAAERGWEELKSEQTLRNYLHRSDVKHLWVGHRYGDDVSKGKYTYQHSTKMPSMRDSLWYGDGTKLNYYYRYQDDEGKWKLGTCCVYEVMDAYSEVFLGYHISKSEDYVAIYEAFKMAVQRSRCRPYQISLDNQAGGKKLTKGHFLTAVARMAIHTKPYNARSKTIENAFGRFQQEYLKQDWYYTGQNVKAKKQESQVNRQFVNAQPIENFPTLGEVVKTYEERRAAWNRANHHATGQSREAMYEASVNPQTPAVDEEDMVRLFWVLRDKPVTYRAEGLRLRRGKDKEQDLYTVMSSPGMPDIGWVREHVDRKFWVYEDPSNPDVVQLCTGDKDNLRMIAQAEQKVITNRGKQEQEAWEAEYYKKIDAAIDAERQAAYDTMEGILKTENRSAEDYGLVPTGLLGKKKPPHLNGKRTVGVKAIGEVMKDESNEEEEMVPVPAVLLANDEEEDEFNIYRDM